MNVVYSKKRRDHGLLLRNIGKTKQLHERYDIDIVIKASVT